MSEMKKSFSVGDKVIHPDVPDKIGEILMIDMDENGNIDNIEVFFPLVDDVPPWKTGFNLEFDGKNIDRLQKIEKATS